MFTTLGDYLHWAEQSFTKAGIHFGHGTNNAWDESVAIALFVLGLAPDVGKEVLARMLSPSESRRLEELSHRRINERIPVPYLSHTAWFFDLPFYVNENVLIPRSPVAELIEQEFLPWLEDPPRRILDLCSGSGCIAVALAKAFPGVPVDAIDIDSQALSVATMNIIRHGVENQVKLIKSDLFSACEGIHYDIIISNPPYVALEEFNALPKEYSHEPRLGLEAGQDGLSVVRRILIEAPQYLSPKGILIVEVGSAAELLMETYPTIPFIWLEFERGGEGVFLLRKEEEALWKVS